VKNRNIMGWVVVFSAISLLSLGCKKGSNADASPRGKQAPRGSSVLEKARIAYPVEVQPVQVRSLTYTVNAVGSIDAFEKVQVTARVAGVVDRVMFSEGNLAKLNQVLVEIEPERYRLAVESAQASYEKAQASLADAEAGLKRREDVVKETPGLIPGEEIETFRTKVRVAASEVAQTKSALDQAKLNLHDAYVRAPLSGIIQTRTVQTGQYIQVGTIMATLIRRDPLLLRFKVPERDAARMIVGQSADFHVRESPENFAAKIVHVAASADETSRMVDVTGEIHETDNSILRPGAFAEVSVPVQTVQTAAVISQTAVRPSERGFLAFVIENNTAKERVLTLGMRTAEGLVEVLSGLSPDEQLVVRGGEALRDGVPVRLIKPGEKKPETQEKKSQ
jgi:multidrug efflux system membrane fusion protein